MTDDTLEAVVIVVREKGSVDTGSVAYDSGRSENTAKEWDILEMTQEAVTSREPDRDLDATTEFYISGISMRQLKIRSKRGLRHCLP